MSTHLTKSQIADMATPHIVVRFYYRDEEGTLWESTLPSGCSLVSIYVTPVDGSPHSSIFTLERGPEESHAAFNDRWGSMVDLAKNCYNRGKHAKAEEIRYALGLS